MKEIWADINGYDGRYQVSTWGRVRSVNGILKPYENEKGYLKIGLMKDGKLHKHRVNRLVAETFIPNYANFPEVNHIDGNKQNNSFTNLEWVSSRQNREHERECAAKIAVDVETSQRMFDAKHHFPEDE